MNDSSFLRHPLPLPERLGGVFLPEPAPPEDPLPARCLLSAISFSLFLNVSLHPLATATRRHDQNTLITTLSSSSLSSYPIGMASYPPNPLRGRDEEER